MAKFKFIFENGDHLYKNSETIQEAAILATSTRILGKKPARIVTSFAEDPASKRLKPISQPCITINLK